MQLPSMDHLMISGPTLAALLKSVVSNSRACDGLLFGDVRTTITLQAHDSSDSLVVEESIGCIATTCTCVATHSFYTNTGDVSGELLQALLQAANSSSTQQQQQQQLLGWFSYRPHSPCMPSMREVAVSQALQQWMASNSGSEPQAAAVFGLITSQPDHNDATLSLQHKFYKVGPPSSAAGSSSNRQPSSSTAGNAASSSGNRAGAKGPDHPFLQPLDLQVYNLGRAAGAAAAAAAGPSSSSWGCSALPALAAAVQPYGAVGGGVLSQQQQQQLLQASSGAAAAALSAVQGLYDSLLDELQVATAQVANKQSQLDALRVANEALRQKVMAAAGAGQAQQPTRLPVPSTAHGVHSEGLL